MVVRFPCTSALTTAVHLRPVVVPRAAEMAAGNYGNEWGSLTILAGASSFFLLPGRTV